MHGKVDRAARPSARYCAPRDGRGLHTEAGKTLAQVSQLVAGPSAFICDECISLCVVHLPVQSELSAFEDAVAVEMALQKRNCHVLTRPSWQRMKQATRHNAAQYGRPTSLQTSRAAFSASRQMTSMSTRVGRPSSTKISPSTSTIATSRPWPVCTRLPSGLT